ncbi:MAG: sigma-70 family RNA polymerase sigma factor [Gammaproteobacteria bacterium]|nr:sigma-70 family RNA polymerase sigma factor [Gammaproteobacteria bacterium]
MAGISEAAFKAWVADHQGLLLHVVRGFANENDQPDLMQDVLVAIWRAMPRHRGESSLDTFLYRVAQNTAISWQRRARAVPQTESLDPEREAAAPPSEKPERTAALYAAIRQLPEIDRALLLMYLDEHSYRDMAESLGLSETNVGARLSRLRTRLSLMNQEKQE